MPVIHLDGPIIEIDEMWLGAKKKDPRGRNPAISQLIFGIELFFLLFKHVGLYCRKTKRIVLYHIPDRKEVTLIPLILTNVSEEKTIISDKFSSYVNIKRNSSKLEQFGISHFWTNHSIHFVDTFQPWIHTNGIERQWRRLRNKISSVKRSFSEKLIQPYLDTFVIKSMLKFEELYEFMLYTLTLHN